MQRLGKNIGRYLGETIQLTSVLAECEAAALAHGWTVEKLQAGPNLSLLALSRKTPGNPPDVPRVYISGGIHGDEPAGPLAICRLLKENAWPAAAELWICPCLNPTGFTLNQRENLEGTDLNRQYLQPKAEEILAHINWLKRQPRFDLCLCLHEDWEAQGFYVYELNQDNPVSLSELMLSRVAEVCPIDPSEIIEGRPARDGIIRPSIDPASRPQWPEAFFLLTQKSRLIYTLEAPSDFPLTLRVDALATAVRAVIEALLKKT
jgi:protein MpaA